MVSRPALLFAALGISGLLLPLVQFKANRIAAGDGINLAAAFAGGAAVTALLGVALLAACHARWPAWLRLAMAVLGMAAITLSLGFAARELSAEAGKLARVAPASGFWLVLTAFALMLADAITRLRLSMPARWLLLGAAILLVAALLGSSILDQVSVKREFAVRREPFLHEARTHLLLAFGSLGLALLAGLPLGVAIFQRPEWRGPVLAVLNILQTIPSLALFGILIPLLGWVAATLPGATRLGVSGIGIFPAMTALFLYSLLPIVSNTVAGLAAVPGPVREAGTGLGMTRGQMLFQVQVPLAMPALLAGMRIVLVQNIGLAVIAGLIGGGGFGTFVFQGLNQTAMDLVLLGALPTIALALLAGIVMDLLVDLSREKGRMP